MTQRPKSQSREKAFIRPTFRRVRNDGTNSAASPFLKRIYKNLPGGIRGKRQGGKHFSRGAGRAYPDLSRFHQRVVIKSRVLRNRILRAQRNSVVFSNPLDLVLCVLLKANKSTGRVQYNFANAGWIALAFLPQSELRFPASHRKYSSCPLLVTR